MDQQFHIGQIARFFDLPASTLRYWDEVGILTPHKNHTNSYREYTVSDLMTISDIIFYKNLGISLQQIGAMEQAEPEEHTRLLCGWNASSRKSRSASKSCTITSLQSKH